MLIDNATHQRGTLTESPVRLPLKQTNERTFELRIFEHVSWARMSQCLKILLITGETPRI